MYMIDIFEKYPRKYIFDHTIYACVDKFTSNLLCSFTPSDFWFYFVVFCCCLFFFYFSLKTKVIIHFHVQTLRCKKVKKPVFLL